MAVSNEFVFYRADCTQNKENCIYPHKVVVTTAEEFNEMAKYDHVCAKYRNDYRGNNNFLWSNTLPADSDNDGVTDASEWITPEDIHQMFEGVPHIISKSKNNMKQKGSKPAVPRNHVFFAIAPETEQESYSALKKLLYEHYPFFDPKALDVGRYLDGTENPDAVFYPGTITLNEHLARLEAEEEKDSNEDILATDSYALPASAADKVANALMKESAFRKLATIIKAYNSGYLIKAKECTDVAQFIPENTEIPVKDGKYDFNEKSVESYKLASFVKLNEAFVKDAAFSIEDYLTERFAKNFGRAEDNAFINGTGNEEPTGILHDTEGADVGVTTAAITYDDVIKLYFSVKDEYRRNGVWMMNDRTALMLRTLKDDSGNYIWNHSNDTIFGKKVLVSEFMPDEGNGNKPIAFGDLSYYWIVDRKPTSIRTLDELFAELGQIGYLAYKFLDAKLIRKDAIKVVQINKTE